MSTPLDAATLRAVLDMIAGMPACTDADWRYELECRIRLAAPRPVAEQEQIVARLTRWVDGDSPDDEAALIIDARDAIQQAHAALADARRSVLAQHAIIELFRTNQPTSPPPSAEAREDYRETMLKGYEAVNPERVAADNVEVQRRLLADIGALRAQVQALTEERDKAVRAEEAAYGVIETQDDIAGRNFLAMYEQAKEILKLKREAEQAERTAWDRAIATVEEMDAQVRADGSAFLYREDVLAALRAARDKETT